MNQYYRIAEVSLTEEIVAVQFNGTWEIYWIDVDGIEMFSHYATPGEAAQIERRLDACLPLLALIH